MFPNKPVKPLLSFHGGIRNSHAGLKMNLFCKLSKVRRNILAFIGTVLIWHQ